MKNGPDRDLRTTVSFCRRLDGIIGQQKAAVKFFEQGIFSATTLMSIAYRAADRINNLDVGEFRSTFAKYGISLERKVSECRECVRETARVAQGCKSVEGSRQKAVEYAYTAIRLHDRVSTNEAHSMIWAASGGLPTEEEFDAIVECEMAMSKR